jgi:hypothetical protein
MTRRTRHILAAIAGLAVLAAAGMYWFRPRCLPETCGHYVSSEIRNLMTWQETYYAQHGEYATSYEALGQSPRAPVVVEFVHATPEGWVARGTHPALEGMSCVAWMGTVPSVPATDRWGVRADQDPRHFACDFPT